MVYIQAAKKTGAFIVLAMALSLAVVTFMSGDLNAPTGRITDSLVPVQASGDSWIIFLLGLLVGAIFVGTYVYIVHLEAKRDQ